VITRRSIAVVIFLAFVLGVLINLPIYGPEVVDAQNVDCYIEQGGAKVVASSGCEYEFQSGSTFDVQANSTVTWAADLPLTGGLTVNNWLRVAAPTAIATATPAAVVDSAGVSVLFEVRDAATPVFRTDDGGVSNLLGNQLNLDADNDTSITADSDDQIDIELEGNDQVVLVAVAAADSAATNEYTEIAFTTPVDTTGVNTHNAITIDLAIGDSSGGTNVVRAIQVDGISADADVSETALNIGAGWDVGINIPLTMENLGALKTISATNITYGAGAGGNGTIATISDGEIWFVHSVFVRTTTNFDCAGDDCTLTIGDDLDVDGFITASDAELQATFTEATGYAAGWYGIENGSGGAYTLDDGGPFVYAPSGADQTIDWVLAAVGDDFSAGAATLYLIYTRIQ
jgi:hypothetical protein